MSYYKYNVNRIRVECICQTRSIVPVYNMTCNRSYCVAFLYCVVIQMCLVHAQDSNKSSLTFVIDDSGSMTDEIEQVKSSVDSIFEAVITSNASQIQNFVLVTFNDPGKSIS